MRAGSGDGGKPGLPRVSGSDAQPGSVGNSGDENNISASSVLGLDALLAEFERRWDEGERPTAEEYLSESMAADEAIALIYHEYCLRESCDSLGDSKSFLNRFPQYRERLTRLLGLREAFEIEPGNAPGELPPSAWPVPGDDLGNYRLIRLLGRGAFARVYLAQEVDLANRLVVVKLSEHPSTEPHLLARARHPHIVEVLRYTTTGDGRFHLICMPYLGGAPLSVLLTKLREEGSRNWPRAGKAWLECLDRSAAPEESAVSAQSAMRQLVSGLNYKQAMCWLVARLAEALDTAHERLVFHGDIKPSNILIASDARPLLLDFNLAIAYDTQCSTDHGGTLAYMCPERLRRLAEPESHDSLIETSGDRRAELGSSDLYSLGLVLHELLGGKPDVPVSNPKEGGLRTTAQALASRRSDRRSVRKFVEDREIPPGLVPVLQHCLEVEPKARYAQGSELSQDLDRWITHQPLAYASQPAWPIRVARWSVRHRVALCASAVFLTICSLAFVGARHVMFQNQKRHALRRLDALWSGREPGVFRFEWGGTWRADDPVEVAEIAQRVLAQFDATGPANWRDREDVVALPETERLDLELWLLEHTLKYEQIIEKRPSPNEKRRALALLERDKVWSNLEPIVEERKRLRKALGQLAPVRTHSASDRSALLETYARGLTLEPRLARRAREQFLHAVSLQPKSFWAHYRVAACSGRLGDYRMAVEGLKRCLARYPKNSALWTQLATCLVAAGRPEEAQRACDQAIELNPDFTEAYRARALLHARNAEGHGLARDLEHYRWLTGRIHSIERWDLMMLLEYVTSRSQSELVFEVEKEPRLTHSETENAVTHALRGCLHEWEGRLPQALAEYDLALEANPDHLWALLRRGQVYQQIDPAAALADYEALIQHDRVEELFGQQPIALRVFIPLVTAGIREGRLSSDDATQRQRWHRAVTLARRALAFARQSEDAQVIVDMEYLLARTLLLTSKDRQQVVNEVAAHLHAAGRVDLARTDLLLRHDRVFTSPLPAPSWATGGSRGRKRTAHARPSLDAD